MQVLDTAFRLPQLQRTRRIWVYLPAGYATSRQRYPVLYLQDGQSVFDAAHATGRGGPVEWQVDETIDAARHPCIIVAVAADAAHRMQDTIRTLPPSTAPALAGSSMGATAGYITPRYLGRWACFRPLSGWRPT